MLRCFGREDSVCKACSKTCDLYFEISKRSAFIAIAIFWDARLFTSESRGCRHFRGSVIAATPAINPLVCGYLISMSSQLVAFIKPRRFRDKHWIAKPRL